MAGRCSLCGSRLNNGKCEFCGLDNRMYDRKYMKDPYHMAEISREKDTPKAPPGQPQRSAGASGKTVFTAKPPARKGTNNSFRRQKQDVSSWQKKQNSGAAKSRAAIVIVILVIIICVAAPLLFQIGRSVIETGSAPDTDSWQSAVDSLFSDDNDSSLDFNDYDPYDYVTREIPEEGTAYEVTLSDGFYQVGIHIPEGVYHVELAEERADLHIADTENIIYDSVWFGNETEYDEVTEADDIRLYNGAEISITGGGSLLFTTANAQPFTQETAANPLTESFILEDGTSTAGEDIPEGMYDILPAGDDEYISFGLDLSYPNDYSEYLWASTDGGETENRIRNVIIPDGTELTLDGGPVEFVPSEGYFEADFAYYPWN